MGGGWFKVNTLHWCDGDGDEFFPEKIISIKGRNVIVLGKSWVGHNNYTDEKQEMWLSILLDEEEDPKKLKETLEAWGVLEATGQEEALLLLEKMAWEEANF